MRRIVLAAMISISLPALAQAAVSLTCHAKGDTWNVTGSVDRRAVCSVTCLLTTPQGNADRVTCSFTTSGADTKQPYCDGSQVGRVWTSVLTLAQQCAYSD